VKVVPHVDPHAFRTAVENYLLRDEAPHNLMLGLVADLTGPSPTYADYRLWSVEDEGRVVGAAMQTVPLNLILARPAAPGVAATLAETFSGEGLSFPGVIGALPEADEYAAHWERLTGTGVRSRMDQAMHVLEAVADVPPPSGGPRPAGPDDLELVVEWYRLFGEEAVPHEPYDEELARKNLTRRLAGEGGHGIWLWEDPEPVCLVGYIDATESAARVAPVYTPPDLRKRGYATALTARVSAELLRRGKRFCMLYTDLANPTSNAIYAKVGYRVICDAALILFEQPEDG
jgi:GNAT superfamily N-acetyltransferase